MAASKFLAFDATAEVLAAAGRTRRVFAPCREGEIVLFRPWVAGDPVPVAATAAVSAKAVLLPPCETLLTCFADRERRLRLETPEPDDPVLLFGCRSCDARGFEALDRACLHGPFADTAYGIRRQNAVIVVRTCEVPEPTCFCTWTGGGPACPEGADVLLTDVAGGSVLEAISGKGEHLLAEWDLPDAVDRLEEVRTVRAAAAAALPSAPDLSAVPERLAARFTDTAFWEAHAAGCLSCGVCTHLCPTCRCFNITDEGDPADAGGSRRLRTWDSCMSALFTREAGGHNPRASTAARLRNRISHKFRYAPESDDGRFSCTGCGRCIRACPVSFDIRDVVLEVPEDMKEPS